MFNFHLAKKKFDILILLVLFIIANILTVYFKFGILMSGVIYFLLPALYLSYVEKKNLSKGLMIILMTAFPTIIFTCLLFEYNSVWDYGLRNHLLLPMLIDKFVPVDIVIWGTSWLLFVYLFYEHFIDRKKIKSINFNKLILVSLLVNFLLIFTLFIYQYFPDYLTFKYAYLAFCSSVFLICIPLYITNFKVLINTFIVIPFFFLIHLGQEYTSLFAQHWSFPGQYIYMLPFFGFKIPIEELIFWFIFSSVFTCFIYEEIFDNQKN